MNTAIFQQLKDNQIIDWSQFTALETYYYVKAHKLVAYSHFISYWDNGQSKDPLRLVLKTFYPPLECNHKESEGLTQLSDYVKVAKPIFKGIS